MPCALESRDAAQSTRFGEASFGDRAWTSRRWFGSAGTAEPTLHDLAALLTLQFLPAALSLGIADPMAAKLP
jgi:hypothetical protein